MSISITVREYNPNSGALLSNISVLNFGRVTAGTTSIVKIIDLAFSEVTVVGNLKLGVISSGGLTVNSNPTDIGPDGSSSSGYFGIMSSIVFDSTIASQTLSRHFPGINATVLASDSNNVSIPIRNSTTSAYIYIDIEANTESLNATQGAYKVFFDFS
jgi:hypothetical protein